MTDLYEELGVDPSADAAEIHAAYRKKAKGAHPDAGGDPAAFHALQRAHDLLSDPNRRARYDQTGDTSEEASPPHPRQRLFDAAATLICQAIDKGTSVEQQDVLAAAIALCRQRIPEVRKQIEAMKNGAAAIRKVIARVTPKDGKPGDSLLVLILDNKARHVEAMVKVHEDSLVLSDEVIAFLQEYRYRVDSPLPHVYQSVGWGLGQQAPSWGPGPWA